jgi:8-oxo-dGTP pyrophosphatase MutT (NUDIX family)
MVLLSGGPRTRMIIRSGGRVVTVKSWLGNGKWSLPGGGLHRHEDPLQGVIREVHEETGLQISPLQVVPLAVQEYRSYGMHFPCHYFAAELRGQAVLKPELIEISETAWLDPDTLAVQNANADVLTALRLSAAAKPARKSGV